MRSTNHQGPTLTVAELALAMVLLVYGNADGTSIRPGLTRLCADLGIGRTAVKRHLRRLEALGYLQLVTRGRGPGSVNLYRLSLPDGWEPCTCPLCRRPGAVEIAAVEGLSTVPSEPRTVHLEPRTVPSGGPLPTHIYQPIDTNSEERSADVTAGVLIGLIDAAATLGELDNLYQDLGHLGHLWDKLWVKDALDAKLRSLGLSPELARR